VANRAATFGCGKLVQTVNEPAQISPNVTSTEALAADLSFEFAVRGGLRESSQIVPDSMAGTPSNDEKLDGKRILTYRNMSILSLERKEIDGRQAATY
jgi:hypothetical protein